MSTGKTKILIVGSKGRMGEALMRLAKADSHLDLIGGVDRDDNLNDYIGRCDVLVEFAHHSLTGSLAKTVADLGKALVIGTTGHTDAERAEIKAVSTRIPIGFAPNYSIGVNLLFHLTKIAAQTLDENYDQEVVEMHHRHKLDAPSGTARRLAEILAETTGGTYADLTLHGRHGDVGARPKKIIGMHAMRGGDVVGDHTVHFAADGERVELTHRASSRDTFATGALRAARWVCAQKPGLYTMQDVLGFGSK
jgi:4-hydroxy-tetrahydrodipicolinate reductase